MKEWNGLPIYIMGSSGTSKEVKSIINDINKKNKTTIYQVCAFVDIKEYNLVNGLKVINEQQFFEETEEHLVFGVVIPFGIPILKVNLYDKVKHLKNVVFPNIIHPSVTIGENVEMGKGNVLAAGATISPNVTIGNFCLINNNCNIGHDSVIEDFVVINPLSAVSGNVSVRQGAQLGGHSAVLQGVEVGEYSQVGLGAFLIKNLPKNEIAICEPAKMRPKK